jgi:hypothetical protein
MLVSKYTPVILNVGGLTLKRIENLDKHDSKYDENFEKNLF